MKRMSFITLFAAIAFMLMSETASGKRLKIDSLSNPFPTLSEQDVSKHKTTNPRISRTQNNRTIKASQSGATILGWHAYPGIYWSELKIQGGEEQLWKNDELDPSAGFIKDDKIYFYTGKNVSGYLSMSYQVCQLSTGAILESGNLSQKDATQFVFMTAYDDVNDVVYAYTYNADGSAYLLQTINPETRTFTKICDISKENLPYLIGFDTTEEKLYGITKTGDFVNISLTDGAQTLVKATGFTPALYKQAMTYSPVDKKFVWAALLSDFSSCVVTIDPKTGTAKKTGTLPDYTEYKVLAAKDKTPKNSTPAAPAIKSFNFQKASLSGTVTVTAPDKYYDNTALTGNLTISSRLDGKEHSTAIVAAGKDADFAFENLSEGNHTFSFYATDEFKNSSSSISETFFVGNDQPLAPNSVAIDANGIKWDAVTGGVNGGYVDADNVTYNVYVNNEKITQSPISATSLAYKLPEGKVKAYVASVEAMYNGKVSEKAKSSKFIYGDPYTLPVDFAFTPDVANICSIINSNADNFSWNYDAGKSAMYYSYGGNNADDWLFLPKIAITDANVLYEVAVSAFARSFYYAEAFEIAYGTSPDPLSMTVVAKHDEVTNTSAQDYMGYFKVPASGTYYIGIHCISPAYRDILYINKVSVKASERSANCPESIENLNVQAAAKGALKAIVGFKMPTKSISGEEIVSDKTLTAVVSTGDQQVSVDGAPGQEISNVEIVTKQGTNEISVAVKSGSDTSSPVTASVFTGVAIPGSVGTINVSLSDDNLTAHLTWKAPSWSTPSDGYYDKESLVYHYCTYTGGKWVEQKALGATNQCDVSVAAGTPMAVSYAGIKAENKGGKSNSVSYATLTIGTPFTLPMADSFRTGSYKYSPIVNVAPNSTYSGKHALALASKYGVTDAEDGQYAMVSYSTNSYAESYCLVALPKFSTVGVKKPHVTLRIWGGDKLANSEVHVVASGVTETKVASFWNNLSAEWHDIEIDLPMEFYNKKWVEVRILSTFYPSEEKYTIVDSYKVYDADATGIADISADTNVSIIPGIENFKVISPVVTKIDVFGSDGTMVRSQNIDEGETTIEIPAGIYVVRTLGKAQKIVVK